MNASSGACSPCARWRERTQKSCIRVGRNTQVLFVWISHSSSFFNPTCSPLCTQTCNCLYIVSLHQIYACVTVCSPVLHRFFKEIRSKWRLQWWQLLALFSTVLMGGLGSLLEKIICMVYILKLRSSLFSTNLKSSSRASHNCFVRWFCYRWESSVMISRALADGGVWF